MIHIERQQKSNVTIVMQTNTNKKEKKTLKMQFVHICNLKCYELCVEEILLHYKKKYKKCVHYGIVRFIMCVSFSYPNKKSWALHNYHY